MNRSTQIRIIAAFLLSILLLGPTAQATIIRSGAASTISPAAAAPSPNLRIVGPAGEDPPVVNERKKLKLRVVDETGADVAVTAWRTGSPAVAKVTKKGVLKGRLYGFATVTAVTGRGEAATTAVVARVTRRHGSMGDGDTKSDSAGRIYLTSPDEQVIYRSDGVRDEIFAGAKGQAGYQDGTGQSARFHYPTGLGVDVSTNGGLYVADTDNHCVRKVGFDGRTSIAVGLPQFAGRIDADVVPADQAAFDSPKGVAAVGSALFVADTRNHALYFLNGSGDAVSLLAGQPGVPGFRNGLFREASFNLPSGLAISTEGNLLAVADTGNDAVRLVRIEAGGSPYLGRVSTAGVASRSRRGAPGAGFVFSAPTSVAFDSVQNVCVVDSQGAFVITRAADGTEAQVLLAQLGSLGRPASIVVSGTRAIIADADASSPGVAIAVVEVGAPRITGVTPSRLPEGATLGEVVIEGENFPPEARVVVDGQLIEDARVESASRIVPDLPELVRGARLVSVITRGGVAQREVDVVPPELDDLAPGEITTFAGTADPAIGDGGRATEAALSLESVQVDGVTGGGNVISDGMGNLLVTSPVSHRVRRVDALNGVATTVVGTGKGDLTDDGLPAVAFGLRNPFATAVGPDGALYIADTGFHRIVRVDPVTTGAATILGTPDVPGAGADGDVAGTTFRLRTPRALALDGAGNLFVSDAGNRRLLRVDAVTGIVSVVAGGGLIDGVPADGELATSGSFEVLSLIVAPAGNLFLSALTAPAGQVVEVGNDDRIRRLASGSFVAGNGYTEIYVLLQGMGIFSARVTRIDLVTGSRATVAGGGQYPLFSEGQPATEAYLGGGPVSVDCTGNLFIADSFRDRILRVDSVSGAIATYAGSRDLQYSGDGGYRTSASFSAISDVAWSRGVGLCLADIVRRRRFTVCRAPWRSGLS